MFIKKAIDVNRHHLLLCSRKIINEKLMFQLMVINVHKKAIKVIPVFPKYQLPCLSLCVNKT